MSCLRIAWLGTMSLLLLTAGCNRRNAAPAKSPAGATASGSAATSRPAAATRPAESAPLGPTTRQEIGAAGHDQLSSKTNAAQTNLATLKTALEVFEVDTGRYPTTSEGLASLVKKPRDITGWHGPYIKTVPVDPWGHAYVYRTPGTDGSDFDLLSMGPDGHEGGGDDIGN